MAKPLIWTLLWDPIITGPITFIIYAIATAPLLWFAPMANSFYIDWSNGFVMILGVWLMGFLGNHVYKIYDPKPRTLLTKILDTILTGGFLLFAYTVFSYSSPYPHLFPFTTNWFHLSNPWTWLGAVILIAIFGIIGNRSQLFYKTPGDAAKGLHI